MATRREIKRAAIAQKKEAKAAAAARKAQLADLPAAERRAAIAADKAAAKQQRADQKTQLKEARKKMTRKERRASKRDARITRKVMNRRRRAIGWGAVAAVVALVAVVAAPFVQDVASLTKAQISTDTPEGEAARANARVIAEAISDEGLVLLKNDNGLLPLDSRDAKVNVFGFASFNLRHGGGGSGGAGQSTAVNLYEALEAQGIAYNPDVKAVTEEAGASIGGGNSTGLADVVAKFTGGGDQLEPEIDYLTDEVMTQAAAYSNVAMVLVGTDAVEVSDLPLEALQVDGNDAALIERVAQYFDDVVVVVNSGNQMELGVLDDYPQIKSAVWMGTPGPVGALSLAKALSGEVTPSGHLTDTYTYDVTSAPAAKNLEATKYDNAKRSFINYEEGIYVGYRYFETYYANDPAGYAAAVQFPFGYGLSYTDFDWEVSEPVVDEDTVSVEVKVTNTGDTAGKDVVQVYYSAPYTAGGIEKSAIELGGYAKTGLLAPGASETVTITFPLRDMASWDMTHGNYILEAGTYDIHVSTDVHSAVSSFPVEVAKDVRYETDDVTGTKLENQFDEAHGGLTYLSRSDWEGTYPGTFPASTTASEELLAAMYPAAEPSEGSVPTTGADNGIVLADLKGLSYDDAKWEDFLDQFTVAEQIELFSRAGWKTVAIDRLGVPNSVLLDGPAGINYFFVQTTAASYPTEVVLASTWNDQLAFDLGVSVGEEANVYGVQGWYAPAMNLHRTAQGGRNFEYFSEDPLLSGKMGAAIVAGTESQNVVTFMKHFVLNEQESAARTGVNVFANEQAMRELYLRPFEITVKEGGATGAMSSFIHIGPTWSGGNSALLQNVLRDEWGFNGIVSSDAVLGSFMSPELAVTNGNELMLTWFPTSTERQMQKAYKNDPAGIGQGLRDRTHAVTYKLLETDLFN